MKLGWVLTEEEKNFLEELQTTQNLNSTEAIHRAFDMLFSLQKGEKPVEAVVNSKEDMVKPHDSSQQAQQPFNPNLSNVKPLPFNAQKYLKQKQEARLLKDRALFCKITNEITSDYTRFPCIENIRYQCIWKDCEEQLMSIIRKT